MNPKIKLNRINGFYQLFVGDLVQVKENEMWAAWQTFSNAVGLNSSNHNNTKINNYTPFLVLEVSHLSRSNFNDTWGWSREVLVVCKILVEDQIRYIVPVVSCGAKKNELFVLQRRQQK